MCLFHAMYDSYLYMDFYVYINHSVLILNS